MRARAAVLAAALLLAGCISAGLNETPSGKLWRQYGAPIDLAAALRVSVLKGVRAAHDERVIDDAALERFRQLGDQSHAAIEAAKEALRVRMRGGGSELELVSRIAQYAPVIDELVRLAASLGVRYE